VSYIRTVQTACLFSGAMILLLGCGKGDPMAKQKSSTPISATPVVKESVLESLTFVGDVKAMEEVSVYSKVEGKLINYELQEGARIKKGDVLAIVDRDEVGFKYQEAPIISPISGTVGRTYLDPGADIRLDTPVGLIVNMDDVRVRIQAAERHAPKLQLTQKARVYVDAFPDQVFEGLVSRISPVIDLDTRTAPLEISISNSGHQLRPGMFAEVHIVIRKHDNALVVPEEAIVSAAGKTFVYVVSDGIAHQVEVSLGIRKPGKVQVKDGLNGDEIVITAGHQKIHDKSSVRIKNTDL
jgi:membrane fusion protein, multidrug efflux system